MSKFWRYQISFVCLLILYTKPFSSLESSTLFTLSSSGYLANHLMSDHHTSGIVDCALLCVRKISTCKSVNYKDANAHHYSKSKNCQLNNATRSQAQAQHFVADEKYDYYEVLVKEKQENGELKKGTTCETLYESGNATTAVYTIDPDGQGPFQVRCDMSATLGRGWTTIQRRVDGSVDFYKDWSHYARGFGDLDGEFWLGLEKIHRLSSSGQNVMRVDLESFENETAYAIYGNFSIASEAEGYRIDVDQYSGNAGDGLSCSSGTKFSTKDVDNDQNKYLQCARKHKCAWWFSDRHDSCLNGRYLSGPHSTYGSGVMWSKFKGKRYSLKSSEMKVGS